MCKGGLRVDEWVEFGTEVAVYCCYCERYHAVVMRLANVGEGRSGA